MNHRRRWVGILLAVLVLCVSLAPPFSAAIKLPERLAIPAGDSLRISLGIPLSVNVQADRSGVIQVNGRIVGDQASSMIAQALSLNSLSTGQVTFELKLLGIIPLRHLTVDIVSPIKVMPGGQSIGVVVQTDGVLVVGHSPVNTPSGTVYPARAAGIQVGDTIQRMNGKAVDNVKQIADGVHAAGNQGGDIVFEIKRQGRIFQTRVRPVYDPEHGRYLIGLWIRDTSAGVGTLTFYDPSSGMYGALGHTVQDVDTGRPLEISRGRIVPADVLEVNRGTYGRPGEKIGVFAPDAPALGDVRRNTPHGIVGKMTVSLRHPLFDEPVPIAVSSQIQAGPAEIVTVVDGQEPRKFEAVIERTLGNHPGGKNMIIRITDPELLAATGGIVQGMSGSPILQNGRLVGAITHVFVNDPARGYGIFIEWMLKDAGLFNVAGESMAG